MRDKKNYITSPKHSLNKTIKTKDLISIILLSENHGYRMKSYGPISLIKIGHSTLLEKQIESIKSCFDNFEIILCSGFGTLKTVNFIKNKFSDLNIRIVENQIHYNSNCCESARLCLNNTNNNKVLFCSGGILLTEFNLNLIDLDANCILMQKDCYNDNFEIGVIENNGKLENFALGIKNKFWSEIFYLNGHKDINLFSSIISNTEYKNKFMFEAINEMNKKTYIKTLHTNKPLTKIDNIKTLKRING